MNRRQFVSSGLAMTGAALSGNNRGICAQTRGDDLAEHFSREALSSVRPSEEATPGVQEFRGSFVWGVSWEFRESESRLADIRQRTHTGRPLGNAEFVHSMEKLAQRRLAPQKRGPREKVAIDRSQGELAFEP